MLKLPSELQHHLMVHADQSIVKTLTLGGPMSPKPWGEVSAVRAICLDGFARIARSWSGPLKTVGCQLRLRSVFTHCKPYVQSPHLGGSGICELADLLLVIDEMTGNVVSDRRAAFVQAKIGAGGRIQLKRPGDLKQRELLTKWPPFKFRNAKLYDQRFRRMLGRGQPSNRNMSAEYGAIDLDVPQWWQQRTRPRLFAQSIELGPFLALMVTGHRLCGRRAIAGASDDWSFTVDEMLKVTAKQPISNIDPVDRGRSYASGYVAATPHPLLGAGAVGASIVEGGEREEWFEGPISTVHLMVGEELREDWAMPDKAE